MLTHSHYLVAKALRVTRPKPESLQAFDCWVLVRDAVVASLYSAYPDFNKERFIAATSE